MRPFHDSSNITDSIMFHGRRNPVTYRIRADGGGASVGHGQHYNKKN